MSALTPRELEQLRQKLAGAGRAEKPDAARAARNLDALLEGRVASAGIEGPPIRGQRRWVKRTVVAGVIGALALWWLLRDSGQRPELVVQGLSIAAVAPPAIPVAEVDAGIEAPVPVPVIDAGPVEKVRKAVEPVDEADLLARELALLDDARTTLTPNPARTLHTLGKYDREFPKGSLRVEADMVRLEALLKLGKRRDAEALGARLTSRDREGLIRERVKRLLDGAP